MCEIVIYDLDPRLKVDEFVVLMGCPPDNWLALGLCQELSLLLTSQLLAHFHFGFRFYHCNIILQFYRKRCLKSI